MNVIILGGTGWVGHHIALAFHEAGHKVTICSRGTKDTYLHEIGEIPLVKANKDSAEEMERILGEGYDVVVDSVPSVASINNVRQYAGSLRHYIHCSSTGGYAPLPYLPGDEAVPYLYALGFKGKSIVDCLAMELHRQDGFPATILRPSYITGPGLLPLDNLGGRREDFIRDILDERPLDLPNGGLALLHPVHVQDLAQAFLLAAQTPDSIGEIYNICLAKAVTVRRYVEITAAALNRKPVIHDMSVEAILEKYGKSISEGGLRFFAAHMCYSIDKARQQLKYAPSFTTPQAIEQSARWAADQATNGS